MILFPIIQVRFLIFSSKNRNINERIRTIALSRWPDFATVNNETKKIVIVVAGLFLNQFLIKEFHLKHLIYQRHLHWFLFPPNYPTNQLWSFIIKVLINEFIYETWLFRSVPKERRHTFKIFYHKLWFNYDSQCI